MDLFQLPDGTKCDVDSRIFSHLLDDTVQCYKFYWLEAIIKYVSEGKKEITFDQLTTRMIANAWHSVTIYHLHLGFKWKNDGKETDLVEEGVNVLNRHVKLPLKSTTAHIEKAINSNKEVMLPIKANLCTYVPFKLLSPFIIKMDGFNKTWNSKKKVVELIDLANQDKELLYTIVLSKNLMDSKVVLGDGWIKYIKENYSIILGWINYQKVSFLQKKNPGVPGIVDKLSIAKKRELTAVRKLWTNVMQYQAVHDIYLGEQIYDLSDCDIDHFVPWSYVGNDELWDLLPVNSFINSTKSNLLPKWETYSPYFLEEQYRLYTAIQKYDPIKKSFRDCISKNLNSNWALENLYVPNKAEIEFKNLLSDQLKRLYDEAEIQGFEIWDYERL